MRVFLSFPILNFIVLFCLRLKLKVYCKKVKIENYFALNLFELTYPKFAFVVVKCKNHQTYHNIQRFRKMEF